MNIKMINTEFGIASCSYTEIQNEFKEKSTVVFLYYPNRDWIVMNEDNPFFERWKEMIQIYVGFDDLQKQKFLEQVKKQNTYIYNCFKVLNEITRIRRRYYRRKVA